jgi:hypothetical protein
LAYNYEHTNDANYCNALDKPNKIFPFLSKSNNSWEVSDFPFLLINEEKWNTLLNIGILFYNISFICKMFCRKTNDPAGILVRIGFKQS